MRKGMTLIEIIFTLVISSILVIGTSMMLKNLSTSAQRAKQLTNLSLDTQSALDQIAALLYFRVPNSIIAYDAYNRHWNIKQISNITDSLNGRVLEWYGTFQEATLNNFISSFIDMEDSNFTARSLRSPNSDFNQANTLLSQKLPSRGLLDTALVFSGGLDMGSGAFQTDGSGSRTSFGWHGDGREDIFGISAFSANTISIAGANQPTYIYEKYYIVDTAYAVTRGLHVNLNSPCIVNSIEPNRLNLTNDERRNLLFLFYDYRPWNGETFCADASLNSTSTRSGKVALLSTHIDGFRVDYVNFTIRITLDAKERLRGSDEIVHVSKQKVVF